MFWKHLFKINEIINYLLLQRIGNKKKKKKKKKKKDFWKHLFNFEILILSINYYNV